MIVKDKIPRFNTIGNKEAALAETVIDGCVLSGFLGGELHGGQWITQLEKQWCKTFKVRHAISCNSATSGLLAACAAVGVKHGSKVTCPTFSMSATAAAPTLLGANVRLFDTEDITFSIGKYLEDHGLPTVSVITNLFGHPAAVGEWKKSCDCLGYPLIEDNAQAPFAMYGDKYAGTIGDIGVFSLNVHKHIQCGEGGVCVTDNEEYANRMRMFINHGELAGGNIGLNLRMTEVTAAIAISQLSKGPEIIVDRVAQAKSILASIGEIPGLINPVERKGCRHVYYALAFRVTNGDRTRIVRELNAEGVPVKTGYLPIHRLPAFKSDARCPVADRLHDHELMLFENCAYSPTDEQIEQIGQAFRKVMRC